ncbi:MAG: DUF4339 domain-containing protein [Prevotella sp.]|nr:DUF4339 domain-containing protein [Prevotella sp.]MBQ9187200.1 DUF4339 domain-containing protein [Prevotella sp.]
MDDNNFFSVDRLVEFGMGMQIARQMVASMNQQFQQMYVPGSIQSMPQPAPSTYYVAKDGKPVGPLSETELSQMICTQQVTKESLCWMPGMQEWKPVAQVPAVLRIVAMTPPPLR